MTTDVRQQVLVGQDWVPVRGTSAGAALVGIGDSANLDAFSRLRVSQPQALFSVQQQYELSPFLMEGGSTGTGTAPAHNANTRMADLVVTAGTGVSFTQSYEYIPLSGG